MEKPTPESCGRMLSVAREDAGISQKELAKRIGKNLKTVKNWELGDSTPNLIDMFEWFSACGVNPFHHVVKWLVNQSMSTASETTKRRMLSEYALDMATVEEITKLHYCVFGNHGSSWSRQIDMLTANNQLPMRYRVPVAQHIYDNYMIALGLGELINPDQALPNKEALECAIECGRQAAREGKFGYTG